METRAEQIIPELHEKKQLKRANIMGNMISESKELLPGIPNDVSFDHISTKLSWGAICILSSVSKAWQQAIRSRFVYDTRVRQQSLETLVLHSHCSQDRDKTVLCLYSSRDERCYELPGIPGVSGGIPLFSKWISSDGKIYVVGGMMKDKDNLESFEQVYVLDVAVERKWKKIRSTQSGRYCVACGALNGKIYSLACIYKKGLESRSEMYNPKTETWYPIQDMTPVHGSAHYRVDAHGEELFVHCGWVSPYLGYYLYHVFHTGKSEWRMLKRLAWTTGTPSSGVHVFMVEGKFYSMNSMGIQVHDDNSHGGAWKDLHSFSFAGFGHIDLSTVESHFAVVIDDELFAIMSIMTRSDDSETRNWVEYLVRSKGFRGEKDEIVWNRINCDHKLKILGDLNHIQL